MIDFRYHVVSIIAVFLALTVGLVIGASIINQQAVSNLNVSLNSETNQKNAALQQVRALEASTALYNSYIDQTAHVTVYGQLIGDTVVVVRLPGLNQSAAQGTLGLMATADAVLGADITVNPTFFDPNEAAAINELVATCTPLDKSLGGATGTAAAMQLLADAITTDNPPTDTVTGLASTTPSPSPSPSATSTPASGQCTPRADTMNDAEWAVQALDAFSSAGLVTVNTPTSANKEQPSAVLMLAPDAANLPAGQTTAYVQLADELAVDKAGPVVAGTANAAAPGGLISAVLASNQSARSVDSCDNTDQTIGQVCVVFVVAQIIDVPGAPAGHYGTSGATNGLLPGLPTPSPGGP